MIRRKNARKNGPRGGGLSSVIYVRTSSLLEYWESSYSRCGRRRTFAILPVCQCLPPACFECRMSAIAMLGNRWWPQAAKQGGGIRLLAKQFGCTTWKQRSARLHCWRYLYQEYIGNGAASRLERDARVFGHTTMAMNDNDYTPPPTSSVPKGMRGQWSND